MNVDLMGANIRSNTIPCSGQDVVVSVGTGDPPPRKLRDAMGATHNTIIVVLAEPWIVIHQADLG